MAQVTTDRRRGINSSAAIKVACIAASTGNLTLSGEQTVDGIALVDGDRVLCKDQSDATENGIYVVSTGTWTRAVDFDGDIDVAESTLIPVSRGTANGDTYWRVTNTGTITIGTTSITLAQGLTAVAISATSTITDESADTTCFPAFVTAATGDLPLKSGSNLTFNSATGSLGFVGAVLAEAADHSATPVAGSGEYWVKDDAPNEPMFTDDVGGDYYLTKGVATVTDHIKVGNMQLWDLTTAGTSFTVQSAVTEATWESIGPTGAGADNTWAALDVIPAAATAVIFDVFLSAATDSTNAVDLFFYATLNGVTPVTTANYTAYISYDPNDAGSATNGAMKQCIVPIDSNQVFQVYWDVSSGAVLSIFLHYRGFVTD